MRIAICDDDREMRALLEGMVRRLCPEAEIFLYSSGEELLCSGDGCDIALLDIQLTGKSGIETARELREDSEETVIIFVTAMEEYVFQAFDVGAFHYIVKPFSEVKFAEVFRNAVERRSKIAALLAGRDGRRERRRIMVKAGGVSTSVLCDDIIYAEVFNRKVVIHGMNGDIEYYGRLSDLESRLGDDFFRSHRAYLVHFKYVEKYSSSVIFMERGQALIAKQKYPEFVKQYLKYNRRKGSG